MFDIPYSWKFCSIHILVIYSKDVCGLNGYFTPLTIVAMVATIVVDTAVL